MPKETTAKKAAEITGVNRNTTREYFTNLRLIIFDSTLQARSLIFKLNIEFDESYFGGVRKEKQDVEQRVKWPFLVF